MLKYNNIIIQNKLFIKYNNPLLYYLKINNNYLFLNKLINKIFIIKFIKFICFNCKKKTIKFKEGYCKKCYFLKKFNICIFKPELCTSHLNIKNKYNKYKKFEFYKHIVYLSYTSNIKIGVTIKKNFKNRLMDQGAIIAIKIAITPNRYISGLIEKICKNKINDKTNYRLMLINNNYNLIIIKKLINLKKKIKKNIKIFKKYLIKENIIYIFNYPIKNINNKLKINIINFNKKKKFKNKLKGIKGQYLIFKKNKVLNIRNNIGNIFNIYIQ
ncbi:MAG: DUF2797 domain-containing protein [Candidatus Shikimatogenerans sp. JK-2022]|nr:DUF2797 domain-containing protein [Candidatus Shikimatogenerans bostrichidophilus]